MINEATATATVALALSGHIERVLEKTNFEELDKTQRENVLNDIEVEIYRSTLLTESLQHLRVVIECMGDEDDS